MKLSRLGEFGLIERIGRATAMGRGVHIGIGDDCAWVKQGAGSALITTDLLIEHIHFDLKWTSFFDLGYKSLAVNLSDIAAMGGVADYAILSLGIPPSFDSKQIDEYYRGFNRLAHQHGVALVGGDTNLAESLIISVCVIGHPPARPIRRSGARIGDDIYVTGTLGDSALGLALLRRKLPRAKPAVVRQLIERHHRPTPQLRAGALLARLKCATAMIDVSDGLLQDLSHICRASKVGAVISNESLPLSSAYRALLGQVGTDYALSGGEDYELLFCARPQRRRLIDKLRGHGRVKLTRIGRCVAAQQGITVLNASGKPIELKSRGHDHFKKQ